MTTRFVPSPALHNWLRRYRLNLAIGLVVALLNGLVWGISMDSITRLEQLGTTKAFASAGRLHRLLEVYFDDSIRHIHWLHQRADMISGAYLEGNSQGFQSLLKDLRRNVEAGENGILQVSATDASGTVIWSTLPLPDMPVNLAEREHINAILEDGLDNYVGVPVQGAISGRRTIQFSHALRSPDGKLLAIDVVSLDAAILQKLAPDLTATGDGIISIVRTDGVVLASVPTQEIGTRLPSISASPALPPDGFQQTMLLGRTDAVRRFHMLRRIGDSFLVVLVGLNEDAQMAHAWAIETQIRLWAALLSLVLVLGGVGAAFGIRRQRILRETRRRAHDSALWEAFLHQSAENAEEIITLLDGKLRHLYVNAACRSMLGIDPQTLVGHRFGARICPEDVAMVGRELCDVERYGRTRRFKYRMRHDNGDIKWLETEIRSLGAERYGTSNAYNYIAISRDVTQRTEEEAVRREVDEQFQTLLSLGPGMLYPRTVDAQGSRVATQVANTKLIEELGYTRDQITASDFFQTHIHKADAEAEQAAFDQCLRSGSASVEYRFLVANGKLACLRDEMRLASPAGNLRRVVGYVTNVTEERETKLRLARSESLATLGRVSAGLAHELNQPLATISMAAENGMMGLRRTGNLTEAEAKFQRILDQTHRVGQIIDHIRQFSRAGKSSSEPFDVPELLNNALLLASSRLAATETIVVQDIQPGLPKLLLPKLALEQVIMNLIANACDAYEVIPQPTDCTFPERRIDIVARSDGEEMLIQIADKAGGIPPDVIGQIFDPFFTTKDPGKGTGLGLSISSETIHSMGGRLSTHNEAGGAVFEIWLPFPAGDTGRTGSTTPTGHLTEHSTG